MSIKRKLLLMVFMIIGAFTLVTVYTVLSFLPLPRISKELSQLRDLGEITLILRGDVNGIASKPLNIQYKLIKESKQKLDESFKVIDKLEYLPVLNSDIAEALEIIGKLRGNFEIAWNVLCRMMDVVGKDAKKHLYTDAVKLSNFWESPLIVRLPDKEKYMLQANVHDLIAAISITELNLSSAYDVMQERFAKIDSEISKRESRIALTIFITIIVVFSLTLFFSILIAKSIGNSIIVLEKGMEKVQKGDLTTEFEIKSKDEVGRLGQNMNIFTHELADSIHQIKISSENNIKIKEELLQKTGQTSLATDEVTINVNGIKGEIEGLDKSVQDSTREVYVVKDHIEKLNNMIQEQNAMVEESTAAVTEMIASISNINDIAARKREATNELVHTALEGGSKLSQTTTIIRDITSSIDEIKGIAGIIQSVAAQTSLLSMNAAIEAAHAGKYGMGFAVVADEIGKLAETSGKNSRGISDVLKKVIEKIESASTSGEETKKAFDNINAEITGVSSSFDEIAASMSEINSGSQQILQAMNNLQDYSVGVQDGSSKMSDSSDHLKNAIGVVESVSQKVLGSISEVSSGITEISEVLSSLNEMSERLSDIAENINSEITRFRTEENTESDQVIS